MFRMPDAEWWNGPVREGRSIKPQTHRHTTDTVLYAITIHHTQNDSGFGTESHSAPPLRGIRHGTGIFYQEYIRTCAAVTVLVGSDEASSVRVCLDIPVGVSDVMAMAMPMVNSE